MYEIVILKEKDPKGETMNLFNFLVWLTTGALIGWFASRMVSAEYSRKQKMEQNLDDSD
jgi:hypothetical protein